MNLNEKIKIFPNDIILGWIYEYSSYLIILNSCGFLLVMIQLLNSYLLDL